ncbi:hypothetical protein P8452_60807 [Trifolium repens]|nr:hypothetical protein P8452_60807 [Trifolium repens]
MIVKTDAAIGFEGFEGIIGIKCTNKCCTLIGSQEEKILVSFKGMGLLVLQQSCGINGVFFYSNKIFSNAGIKSSNAATFGLRATMVVITGVATWLVDRSGRRVLLISTSYCYNILFIGSCKKGL